MISDLDFMWLKSPSRRHLEDKLILTNLQRSNKHHGGIFNQFQLGDEFILISFSENKIDLIHSRSDNEFWFTESTIKECFDTIQSIRNNKIKNILHENS